MRYVYLYIEKLDFNDESASSQGRDFDLPITGNNAAFACPDFDSGIRKESVTRP